MNLLYITSNYILFNSISSSNKGPSYKLFHSVPSNKEYDKNIA